MHLQKSWQSFSQQLEFGIRYFDIDTCYGESEAMNCHCNNGKDCAYAGSIEKGLSEINKWMNSHPDEIAVVHFNRDVQNYKVSSIYESIASSLLKFWKPNASGKLAMSTYYKNNNYRWPLVGYQFMFRSPKQRLGRLGIIEGQGQASVLVFSIMG